MFPKSTPIITKSKFIQIILQIFRVNPVVRSPKPCFKVPYYSMHPRENLACLFTSPLDFWAVFISQGIQPPITIPTIGINLAASDNISANKWIDGLLGNISYYTQTDSASMIPSIFNRNNYRNFSLGATSAVSFFGASDISIVYFYNACKRFSLRINHGITQALAKIQGGFIRAYSKLFLQLQRRHTRGQSTHKISSPEPVTNRYMAVMENCSRCNAYIPAAFTTTKPAQSNSIRFLFAAFWTFKSFWPTYAYKIFNTGFLGRKPSLKFAKCRWKLGIPLGRSFSSHFQCILSYLVASSG